MKKAISLLLAILMTISIMTLVCLSVSAKDPEAFGDMDGNYEITASDALVILQGAVKKVDFNETQNKYADVDVDKKVSAADALTTLQYAGGKIHVLPTSDYYTINNEDLLVDLDGSLIDNGAYSEDVTSDNSFKITTEGLQENTIYLLTTRVFSSNNATYSLELLRFITCLQGLINRDFGITHTSLVYIQSNTLSTEGFWLEYMTENGNMFNGYEQIVIGDFEVLVETFVAQISQCGISLWDPDVPSTSNVANTVCGLDGYLPIQYNTNNESLYTVLTQKMNDLGKTLKINLNLVGKFTGTGTIPDTKLKSTSSSKCDAYLWAMEKYFDRCSTKFVAYTLDQASTIPGNPTNGKQYSLDASMLGILNYDYLIARRCFFIDLTAQPNDSACDDPTQPVGTDANTFRRFLLKRYDRANGNFGVMIGFSPYLIKYTNANSGYTSCPSYDPCASEFLTTETFTAYNMATEADAPSPVSAYNCSVYYKYIVKDVTFDNPGPDESITYDPDTYYYFIDVGDYDSSIWQQYFIPKYFTDKNKNTLPLFWNINPNNTDRIPVVFEYMYKNRTDMDVFSAGDSGAGYVWPVGLIEGHQINTYGAPIKTIERTLPSATEKWYAYCKKYYDLLNYDINGFLLDVNYTLKDKAILDCYNKLGPTGGFYQGSDSQVMFKYNGVTYLKKISAASEAKDNYNYIIQSRRQYNKFTCLHTAACSPTWFYTMDNRIQSIAESKGVKVQWVDVYTFFKLLNESGAVGDWYYSK